MVVEDDEFGTTNGDERRRDAAASESIEGVPET